MPATGTRMRSGTSRQPGRPCASCFCAVRAASPATNSATDGSSDPVAPGASDPIHPGPSAAKASSSGRQIASGDGESGAAIGVKKLFGAGEIGNGQTARFLKVYDEYKKAPDVTRKRMYLETMERVLGGTDKIIMDSKSGQGVVPYLPLDQLQKRKEGTN